MNLVGLLIVVCVLVGASAFAIWRNRTDGVFTHQGDSQELGASSQVDRSSTSNEPILVITEDDLGQPLGTKLTLVQFSSAFCQPCRVTKRIIGQVLESIDDKGISHVEVDAELKLDLTRKFDIRRTPTVIIVDELGCELDRASGQLTKPGLIAAIDRNVTKSSDPAVDNDVPTV